ncbi:hypothetical protein IOC51_23445 [Vibrio parahaemolyticus]|uniref:hypothetical protein n=1 Tax=Vibrio parahaemolyticus TaxID=670 RepID=UPI001E561A0B|nr:hypothetical protein [Vibrio parahaemolyticus]MCD1416980.1 hypothetical protein [Vibrio parahaemolyticus]
MNTPFNLSPHAFQTVMLKAVNNHKRDVLFDGAELASVKQNGHHYQLFHTRSDDPNEQLIVSDTDLLQGHVLMEAFNVDDSDALEAMFGLDVMYEVCRQCQYPGYQTLGTPLGEWA